MVEGGAVIEGMDENKSRLPRFPPDLPPATVDAIKKEEPTEERAFNTYLEARRSVLFEEFVAKRQEEYEKRRQTTMKSNAEVRQHPIVIESDDDNAELTTDNGPQEAMEVTTTATSRNAGPSHLSSRNKDDIGYISPLALAKPEVLPMKQRLQLAEERLAGRMWQSRPKRYN